MSRKFLVMAGMTVGSLIGGYVPMLWGADLLSVSSVLGNAVGGLLGIWIAFKMTNGFS